MTVGVGATDVGPKTRSTPREVTPVVVPIANTLARVLASGWKLLELPNWVTATTIAPDLEAFTGMKCTLRLPADA